MSDYNQSAQPVRQNGVYEAGVNDYPSSVGLVGHEPSASPSGTQATKRITVADGENNAKAIHVAMRDGNGNLFDVDNPLPTYPVDAPGVEVHDYNDSGDIAKDASANHDLAVSGNRLKLTRVEVSSSDEGRFELQVKTTSSGSFVAKGVRFASPANKNAQFELTPSITIEDGGSVRVVKKNLSNGQQSLYSTIMGSLV